MKLPWCSRASAPDPAGIRVLLPSALDWCRVPAAERRERLLTNCIRGGLFGHEEGQQVMTRECVARPVDDERSL